MCVCLCVVCVCACVQFTLWLVVCESVGYMSIFGCILYMMCFLIRSSTWFVDAVTVSYIELRVMYLVCCTCSLDLTSCFH